MQSSTEKKLPVSQQPIEPRKCENCDLATVGINCLAGQGPSHPKIMLVGSHPGDQEGFAEEPFQGATGNKLNYLLERAGLKRADVFLTYAVKCQTPKNRQPAKKALANCKMHLLEELAYFEPKVIVTFGGPPLKSLLPDSLTPTDARGFPKPIFSADGDGKCIAWVVPTISLDQALAVPEYDAIVIRDLKLAKEIAEKGYESTEMPVKKLVATGMSRVREFAIELMDQEHFSFDLETTGLEVVKDDILTFNFGLDDGRAFVIPYLKDFDSGGKKVHWSDSEKADIINIMKEVMISKAKKTAHNGKFDLQFHWKHRIPVRGFDFDTMLAHALVDNGKPHNLMFVGQWYGVATERYDIGLEKHFQFIGERNYSTVESNELFYYGACDVFVTNRLRPILEQQLKETGTHKVFTNISMPMAHLLARMEFGGAKIDLNRMDELIKRVDVESKKSYEQILELTGSDDFNVKSPQQVRKHLLKHDAPLTAKTKTGQLSVNKEVLAELTTKQIGGELPKLILKYRQLQKLKGTYLDGEDGESGIKGRLDDKGHVHSNYNIHVVYTGRLSSDHPNLQNIPPVIRPLFVPDEPGDVLCSVDYKQIEVRVAAHLSRDRVLIDEIRNGVDMHSRNAATFLLRIPEEEFIKTLKDEALPLSKVYAEKRKTAKAVTFGVLYGSTATGVAKRNKTTVEEAELFISRFFRKYRELSNWIDFQHQKVRQTKVCKTPTGRFYYFDVIDWMNSKYCDAREKSIGLGKIERISVNMPIQGYAGELYSQRKLHLQRHLDKLKLKSRILLTIHDGLIINCKPNERETIEALVPEVMNFYLNKGTQHELLLEVDMKFMDRWRGE